MSGIDDVLHAPDERHRARALPRVQRVRVDGAHLHVSKQRALKGGQSVGRRSNRPRAAARLVAAAAATVSTAAATASTEPIVSTTVTIVEIFAKSVLIAPAASSKAVDRLARASRGYGRKHTTRSVPITTLGFGGALVVHVTARATTTTVFLARVAVADVVVTDVVISIGRRLVLNRKRSVTICRNARASDVDREARLARS